ncbi:MAG: GNAT family N-acetyltransferase [Bacteriovoracaceae bacterium]
MIKIYTTLEDKDRVREKIKEIFFLTSSRKLFDSEELKEAFFKKWTSYYFEKRPGFIYVAIENTPELNVLGYLTIEPDSLLAKDYFKDHAHYLLFEDFYADFTAHLHINCHPDTQGKGVGSALIKRASDDLKHIGFQGLHLITSPTARNVDFYRKNGFTTERTRTLNDINYLFMGKKL